MATYKKRRGWNQVSINGKVITTNSNNITMSNNKIIIDGVDVTPESKNVFIHVDGDIKTLDIDACNEISIAGSSGSVKTQSGNVNVIHNITGNVKTMSGNVKCNKIDGNVKTMSGDIKKFKK